MSTKHEKIEKNINIKSEHNDLEKLMDKIGYKFKNMNLLEMALTHRSYSNENFPNKQFDNEKLEFLGDTVVNLIITEYLYKKEVDKMEGELAKLKSQIISEPVFAEVALELELGKYLKLSNGEDLTGGRKRKSILGDAFEAIIGGMFLDSNYDTCKNIILNLLIDKINNVDEIDEIRDDKTHLQELFQKKYRKMPKYSLESSTGPDHNKSFTIVVKLDNEIYGRGTGPSKKIAEKRAAKMAVERITEKKSIY